MCFHLYSPGKQIDVKYMNESVRLLYSGRSKITALIVLENKTPGQNLEELFLFYPNAFYHRWDKQMEEFKERCAHEDHTAELRYPTSPKHYPYTKDPKRGFRLEGVEAIIQDFYPTQKDRQYEYRASIDMVRFGPYIPESVGIEGFRLLQKLRLTVFKFSFNPAIPPAGTRALKVFFQPRQTAVVERTTKTKRLLKWLGREPLKFELMGPFDVVKMFEDKCSLIATGLSDLDLEELWQPFSGVLRREYIENGFQTENTATVFHDYRLQISVDRLMSLFRRNIAPTKEGCIKECEPFPDYFFSETGSAETVYQYYTGREHFPDLPEKFSFRVVIHA